MSKEHWTDTASVTVAIVRPTLAILLEHLAIIRVLCYTLWEIWKGRNETILQRRKFDPMQIQMKVKKWLTLQTDDDGLNVQTREEGPRNAISYWYQHNGYQIVVDGSWDQGNKSGSAFLIYRGGRLLEIGYNSHNLQDAFHAEVLALKEALCRWMEEYEQEQYIEVFSDYHSMVQALNEEDVDNVPNWRAMHYVLRIIQMLKHLRPRVQVRHVTREAVGQAHLLANLARRNGVRCTGTPRIWHAAEGKIEDRLAPNFFQRVQEAPP